MKQQRIHIYRICIGSSLTALTVLFQSAPLFLPAFGLAISPFSTLPIAIAAIISITFGISVFVCSAFILIFISIQETLILIFATGLLGIILGSLLNRKSRIVTILISSIVLTLGILFLIYIVGIMSFVINESILYTFLLVYVFSFIYANILRIILKKFNQYLTKINLIHN